jgi:hypothetical protein
MAASDHDEALLLGPVVPHAQRLGNVPRAKLEEMQDHIEALSPQQLVDYTHLLFRRLQVDRVFAMGPNQLMQEVGPRLGFSFDHGVHETTITDFLDYNLLEVSTLARTMVKLGMWKDDADRRFPDLPRPHDIRSRVHAIQATIHTFNRLVLLMVRLRMNLEYIEEGGISSFFPKAVRYQNLYEHSLTCPGMALGAEAGSTVSEWHELLLYLLDAADQKAYRKSGDYLYKRVLVPDPSDPDNKELRTHAWQEVCSVEEFVQACCPKETNFHMWRLLITASRLSDATRYLTKCIDPELPTLAKDRHVFAFNNGTYVTWWQHEDGHVSDLFVPYDNSTPSPLHGGMVASNYFKQPMEYFGNRPWQQIPTPNLDKILDTQRFLPEVKRWMYVFIGRMLYTLGDHDNWQVIPFLKGMGGCGKSTIINDVCGIFYHKHDIAVLSNNCEKRFGLSGLVGHFMFLAPEIKGDFQLEQAEFQSMVSGEDIQINKKHETARSVVWDMPGMLAGNEMPKWVDNSGSIARRVVVFFFGVTVSARDGDTELKTKLRAEVGNILQKCSRAYAEAVQQVRTDNVWLHLPHYFTQQQNKLRMEANTLEHFLGSDFYTFGADEYVAVEQFKEDYKNHCRANNLQIGVIFNDNSVAPFARYNLTVTEAEPRQYPPGSTGAPIVAKWVVGAGRKESDSGLQLLLGGNDTGGM